MTSQAMLPSATSAGQILPLRDYQQQAIDAVFEARGRGVKRQLLSLATGAGKTVIAAHLVRQLGMRTVFMVHRDELATQSMAALARINPGQSIGLCKAERNDLGADLIVASAQTLARQSRLERLVDALAGFPVLFVSDEAHHDRAESRMRAIDAVAPELLIGLTATPTRGDKLGLDAVYEEIVCHVPMLDLMRRNYLARLKGIRIETETDLDNVRTRGGEFVERDLSDAVNTPERNEQVVAAWLEHARTGETLRKRTLAFCASVQHARDLADAFRAAGVDAETVTGETPPDERREIFGRFHQGALPVLTNVMVLTEGYDEPAIDCILMCRPTKSSGLYIQMAGRGARKSPEKSDCLIIDFADNTARHTLVMFPTLAGDELSADAEQRIEPGAPVDLMEVAEQVQLFKKQRAVEVDLFGQSPVVWQRPGTMPAFFAPAGGDRDVSRYVVVIAEGDGYRPILVESTRESASSWPLFDRALDVETAQAIAEEAVEKNTLTSRKAAWRQREDRPTEAQLRFARNLGVRGADQMTKAQLSEAIDLRLFIRAARRAGLEIA